MSRATNKLLAILLSLSLGMAPLQGAFAALVETVGQQGMAGEVAAIMADCHSHTETAQQSPQAPCPDCASQDGSNHCTHYSSGGHCAGCLLAVLHDIRLPVNDHTAAPHWQAADVAVTSFSTTPLYRPPRA